MKKQVGYNVLIEFWHPNAVREEYGFFWISVQVPTVLIMWFRYRPHSLKSWFVVCMHGGIFQTSWFSHLFILWNLFLCMWYVGHSLYGVLTIYFWFFARIDIPIILWRTHSRVKWKRSDWHSGLSRVLFIHKQICIKSNCRIYSSDKRYYLTSFWVTQCDPHILSNTSS